jgi:hypothetical protein
MKKQKTFFYVIALILLCFIIYGIRNYLVYNALHQNLDLFIDGNHDSIGAVVTVYGNISPFGNRTPGFHTVGNLIDSNGLAYKHGDISLTYGSYTTVITKSGYKTATTLFNLGGKSPYREIDAAFIKVHLAPINSNDSSYASVDLSGMD